MSKKRKQSSSSELFAAITKLESDDAHALKVRLRATASTVAKSYAARAQVELTGTLLECRILMQRALGEATTTACVAAGNNDGGREIVEAAQAADGLLAELLEARRDLCLDLEGGGKDDGEDDDDDDDDVDYRRVVSADTEKTTVNDHDSDDDSDDAFPQQLEATLQNEYATLQSTWRKTFDRRHADLRLHSGLTAKTSSKFRVVDQSFWDLVLGTVEHERLMAHRGVGGGADGAVGEGENDAHREPGGATNGVRNSNAASQPVFDDSKVYQHLLRDFVASSGSSGGGAGPGPGAAAAKAAAERLRRAAEKKKRGGGGADGVGVADKDVDRRASKGRKIRYAVHPKLENFTFPTQRQVTPAIEENEWFRSLFGGAGRKMRRV